METIEVDLTTESATFTGDNVNLELVKAEVEKVGYIYGGVK